MGNSKGQPTNTSSDFGLNFPRACVALEDAVCDLISNGWEESRRRLAQDMAVAMTQAAKAAGWWETESILRPLSQLLGLSSPEVISVRQAVRDKMLELLNLLKKNPASRSA
jgi:hypothetical protein